MWRNYIYKKLQNRIAHSSLPPFKINFSFYFFFIFLIFFKIIFLIIKSVAEQTIPSKKGLELFKSVSLPFY